MILEMKLDDGPYKETLKKKKTLEVRLCDEKRACLRNGDYIIFTNAELGSMKVGVLKVTRYKDIFELVNNEDIDQTGSLYRSKDHWIESILKYYPIDTQRERGLLAIKITLDL